MTAAPAGVHAFARRNTDDSFTSVIVTNWNDSPAALTFLVDGRAAVRFSLAARSMGTVEIPDMGNARGWGYGQAQFAAGAGPEPLECAKCKGRMKLLAIL